MNFLGYFVLAAAVVLVSSVQQSDANNGVENFIENQRERDTNRIIKQNLRENVEARIFDDLTQAYNKSVQIVKLSETIMIDGLNAAENSKESIEAIKQILLDTFEAARNILYQSGVPVFSSIGRTFGLLNDGARPRLTDASVLITITGREILSAMNVADSFTIDGIDAGGKAVSVLFKAARLVVESAFTGGFNNYELSRQKAYQALRDAQSSSQQRQTDNSTSKAAENDRDALDAINEIDKAINIALNRGANSTLVQKFRKILKSSLNDAVLIADKTKRIVENFKKSEGITALAAKISYFQQTESLTKGVHEVTAKMILGFGEVAQSDNESNGNIIAAIRDVEEGLIEMLLAMETSEDLIDNGMRWGGDDAIQLALEAADKMISYGKLAIINGIVKAAKQVLTLL